MLIKGLKYNKWHYNKKYTGYTVYIYLGMQLVHVKLK